MGRLCGGAHEIIGIKVQIFLCGWVGVGGGVGGVVEMVGWGGGVVGGGWVLWGWWHGWWQGSGWWFGVVVG